MSDPINEPADVNNDAIEHEHDADGGGNVEDETGEQTPEQPDDDEVVIGFGDAEEEAKPEDEDERRAPTWVKDLRKANREKERKIKELEAKLNELTAPKHEQIEVGPRPALADYDYDEDKYSEAVIEWRDRKAKADAAKAEQEREYQAQVEQAKEKHAAYVQRKSALKVSDFDDAEDAVVAVIPPAIQQAILHGADDPAALVYALGRDEKRLKQIAEIKDPAKQLFALAKLETQLKVTTRKPPAPDKTVTGNSGVKTGDRKLKELEDEYYRTGDATKLRQYRAQLAKK